MKTTLIILLFLLSAFILSAFIINIPDDYTTIQAGIDASVDGDTVLVQPGTYVENINYNGKLITVASLFLTTQETIYISETIIDGDHSGRVVIFAGNEDSTAVLTGFTITNGYVSNLNGAGIYCYQSNPSIISNNITGNEAYPSWNAGGGGGIYCDNSSPYLENLTIAANSARTGGGILCFDNSNPRLVNVYITGNSTSGEINDFGGGICCWNNSSPILLNVYIAANTAYNGGGICCSDASPSLENVTIVNNSAAYNGGGIYCGWYSNPSLVNVTITGNSAEYGSGIDCYESSPFLQEVTISDNSAAYNGGGIYCYESSLILQDVTISGNSADEAGGGIYSGNSSPSLENVMICSNSAEENGGGIYCELFSSPSLTNVIISDNGAFQGSGIYCSNSSPTLVNVTLTGNSAGYAGGICCYDNSSLSLVNCILWNDSPQEIYFFSSSVTATYSDIAGGWTGTGNIDAEPLFAGIGSPPFSLLEDSPCIDTGIPDTTGLNLPPWDILCNERIWDGDEDGIAIIDMGAYEYGAPEVGATEDLVENYPDIVLHQNYPNPFNPTTTISFQMSGVSSQEDVELTIYNIKGQRIKKYSIFNIQYSITNDQYSITWDGRDDHNQPVSSGIYLYKLQAGNQVLTRKMILIK